MVDASNWRGSDMPRGWGAHLTSPVARRWLILCACVPLWSGCAASIEQPLSAPSLEAQEEFAQARVQGQGDTDWEANLTSLAHSAALAPDWPAPNRNLDDLRSALLQGPKVLRERWLAWKGWDQPAMQAYLIGRKLPGQGSTWFESSTRLQKQGAWGWHGRAFEAVLQGRTVLALRYQKKALQLARDPFEVRFFAQALARRHVAGGDSLEACAVLDRALEQVERPAERTELKLSWVESASKATAADLRERGAQYMREMLVDSSVSEGQLRELLAADLLGAQEKVAWLLGRGDSESTRLALRLMGSQGEVLLQALDGSPLPSSRVELFASGDLVQAMQLWWDAQPDILRAEEGNRLAHWMDLRATCESWQANPEADSAERICEQLLAVGWFDEMRAFVQSMPSGLSLDRALEYERRASLGLLALERLKFLLSGLDHGQARVSAQAGDGGRAVDSLQDLLQAVAQVFEQTGWADAELVKAIEGSPLQDFGPFASVVHPGPLTAPWDQGLGPVGTPVPGLAQALAQMGRVGIFGSAMGVPPDGTVLRLLAHEAIEGQRLGVPFFGTVLWCDGADVGGAAMRLGGSVAGAALHEGYYVDVAELRRYLQRWTIWNDRWEDPSMRAILLEGLADPGLPVAAQQDLRDRLPDQGIVFRPQGSVWLALDPLLGQADRLRLTLLLERGDGQGLGRVSLDELIEVTAIHEEGHLCERTRFLPFYKNLGSILAFAASEGFSPTQIQQALEYRAELVALCEVPEPRLVLVDMLDLAENRGSGLPHAPAYRNLLQDLMGELDRGLQEGAQWVGDWRPDREYQLVHQLHHLPAEVLRTAARKLARKRGLFDY